MIWIEVQLSTQELAKTLLPDIDIFTSNAFHYEQSILDDWLRSELSRSLPIVNTTAVDQLPRYLEAAYGHGARELTSEDCKTVENQRFVGIARPAYHPYSDSDKERNACYFAVAVCRSVDLIAASTRLKFGILPIEKTSKCPVRTNLFLQKGESVAFWIPFCYPLSLMSLTGDERRHVSFEVNWTRRCDDPKIEALSFPRLAAKFRVGATTPEYKVSPVLPNDPPVWQSRSTSFALEAVGLKTIDLTEYGKVGIFLELEDSEYKDQRQILQVWVSIIVGLVVSGLLTEALNDKSSWERRAMIIALVVVVLGIALWKLLPEIVVRKQKGQGK